MDETYPSILMIMPYFGRWPAWIDLTIESCKWNPTVNWLFFTDCSEPANKAPNVRYVHTSFTAFAKQFSQKLGVPVALQNPYKLCDLKPAYGDVFEAYLDGYDYWGFGDIDVIYGNIRNFYGENIHQYKVVSSRNNAISGHFCLLQNTRLMRRAYRSVKNWQNVFNSPEHYAFDELAFGHFLILSHTRRHPALRRLFERLNRFAPSYFVEQYSTFLDNEVKWCDGTLEYPSEWIWRNGRLTTNKSGEREFLYVHFMQWKSSTYLRRIVGEKAAWEKLERLVHVDFNHIENGFKITPQGFHSLDEI